MNHIEQRAWEIATKEAEKLNLEILDVEYVKEPQGMMLRVIAESAEGLTIDQSADLNQAISDELDKVDFIPGEYFLEVCSAGLEREIKKEEDYQAAIGDYIFVKTYEKINGLKEIYGDLLAVETNQIKMKVNIKGVMKEFVIARSSIAKIRHAVKF